MYDVPNNNIIRIFLSCTHIIYTCLFYTLNSSLFQRTIDLPIYSVYLDEMNYSPNPSVPLPTVGTSANISRASHHQLRHLHTKLRENFPLHSDAILNCPKCMNFNSDNASFVINYPATCFGVFDKIHHFQCLICSSHWFVCRECKSQKTHYTTMTEVRRHVRVKGHIILSEKSAEPDDSIDIVSGNNEFDEVSMEEDALLPVSTSSDSLFPFCSKIQANYFAHNPAIISKDEAEGMRYLVSNALHKKVAIECMKDLSPDHIMFHSNLAFVSSRMAPIEKKCLVNSFYYLERLSKAGCSIDSSIIPTNMKLLDQRYLKRKHSFMQNIPRPPVTEIGNHAYVSLKSCIADLLARHDSEIEILTDYDGKTVKYISQSARAQSLIQSMKNLASIDGRLLDPTVPRLILHLIEWSDDFDPAKCIKDNRGSAWIKTVTISPVDSTNREFKNTYPIAVGRKNESHEVVEQEFMKELAELRSGNLQFRLGKYGVLVYVYVDIVTTLQDQIERRSMNNIMLGGSTCSARWGYSCDFFKISEQLPCCTMCWNSLKRGALDSSVSCDACLHWDMQGAKFQKPTNYPRDIVSPDEEMLESKKISYESLKNAVKLAVSSMSRSQKPWTKKTCECYLSTEGINSEFIEKIAKHAKRQRVTPSRNEVETSSLDHPALWNRGVPLICHIDVPMHLIFLGIVKSTVALVNEWMATNGWNLMALSRTNITLDSIKNLNISWCRTLPQWTGQASRILCTTGWVSENYLAMSRLFVWYYSELITKVVPADSVDYEGIVMLLSSLRAMVSRVMTRDVDENKIQDVERHIKIFLQCFHKFTKSRKDDTTNKIMKVLPKEKTKRKRKRSNEFGADSRKQTENVLVTVSDKCHVYFTLQLVLTPQQFTNATETIRHAKRNR